MSLKGTLKDFSVSDIFQLIGQQRKSGALLVSSGGSTIRVYFANGQLVRADVGRRYKDCQVLGQMLLRAGLINDKELHLALRASAKTFVPLERILLDDGTVPARDLFEFARLRTMETVARLFSWKEGLYEFEACEVTVDPDFEEPVSPESTVMDAYRRLDEWPSIKEAIPFYNTTFVIDPGVSTGKMSDTDLRILNLLREDDRRDVQTLIDLSRLGEFGTLRALFNLKNAGVVQSNTPKKGARVGSAAGGPLAVQNGIKPPIALAYTLTILAFLLCAALFGRTVVYAASSAWRGRTDDTIKRWAIGEALSTAQKRKLELAIETWKLTRGNYPASLDLLVEMGLVEKRDISYPWKLQYTYFVDGKSFVLMDPPY